MDYARLLNLGCGYDHRHGYLNVDNLARHEPDMLADVRDLSALPSDWFDEILAHDVLEHLPRADTAPALREWSRVLRKGGTISLRVPSFLHLAEVLLCGDYQSPGFHAGIIQCAHGTQAYDGDFHFTSFTPLLLQQALKEVGLMPQSAKLLDGWMLEVVAEKGAQSGIDLPRLFGRRSALLWRLTRAFSAARFGRRPR
jgi:SAM-dependent methyltransferase